MAEPQTCSACGQENPPIARFCLTCGASLSETVRHADERRLVTIIFVDLVGFTKRAEQLDPEDVMALLSPYHDRVRSEIESFGGVVEKFIGDAVMGVFGAPVSHGDDAERAVRAALAIRDIAGEMIEGGLQLRTAVNTGEAIVSLGARPAFGEAMVAGDVVNTAARLQTAAPVNGVVVGEETYRATNAAIRYEPSEPVVAKGKERPIPAWLAIEPLVEQGMRPAHLGALVGRGFELAILGALWERASASCLPTLVSVIGPSGVGKTTLATGFCAAAAESGARVVTGRSLPYRESGAYGALAGQVMRIADVFESDSPAAIEAKLRATSADVVGGTETDPEAVAEDLAAVLGIGGASRAADRNALFYSVREFFEGAARQQPTILVFEDIHWADTNLLDLVLASASLMRRVPLMILTLARPELCDQRPNWGSGLPEFLTLTLGPLDPDDARQLAMRRLGDKAQADAVLDIAEGNPLFIEQLAASIGQTAPGRLPTTIREIVAARLDALPPDERALLLDASVVGKVFWVDALRALSASTTDPTPLVDRLERRDLIRRETGSLIEGKPQYAFTHALIREVAYDMLARAERTRRHGLVAEFFSRTVGETAESIGVMARHWRAAGRDDVAVEHLIRAAHVAEAGWAKDHAAFLYREALSLIPEDDVEQRRTVRRRLALASTASMHVPDIRPRGNPRG
ncbi:MAG TPA: AAA family ATPase [Mycobacteriales bacterium]|nr:AAA family ATPase [Mycobacteriales bacterium]